MKKFIKNLSEYNRFLSDLGRIKAALMIILTAELISQIIANPEAKYLFVSIVLSTVIYFLEAFEKMNKFEEYKKENK